MINALMGGVLIGTAVSIMLVFNGRVTGISGILAGILKPTKGDVGWRVSFVLGLLFGGIFLNIKFPEFFIQNSQALWFDYITAGLS